MNYLRPRKKKKFDEVYLGIITGIIVPIISVSIYYFIKYADNQSIIQFILSLQGRGLFSKIISLAAIPNLLLFFIYLWTNRNFSARGVIIATFVYVIFVLILKII